MKRISIKRELAVMLAALLMLQTQSAIASENQANEAAEKQTNGWSKGTEEASSSNDRGSLYNDGEALRNRKESESEKKKRLDADVIATPNTDYQLDGKISRQHGTT